MKDFKDFFIRYKKNFNKVPNGSSASQIKNMGRVQWTVLIFFMALIKVVCLQTNCFC